MPGPFRSPRLFVALAVAASGLSASLRADERSTPQVIVRVGEATIDRSQLEAALARGNASTLPAGPPRQQAEAAALEQLVDATLLREAVARDGIQADASAVDAAVAQLQSQLVERGGTLAAFLAQTGRDEAGFREQVALELAMRQFAARRVTPQAVEAYFQKNRRELDGTALRVSHVVLRPDLGRGEAALEECLARAMGIRSRILQGETTFAEAARAHSAGPSRRRGGDVGFMPRRGAAHEEFARQAFALAKGDISKPFVTPFGVHILQVTDVQAGERSLAALRPVIEQALVQQIVRDAIAESRRATAVEYAPGVAYFDPETPADGPAPRRVLVAGPVDGR